MESEIQKFISAARKQGLNDNVIKQKLLAGGWEDIAIDQALHGIDPLIVPMAPGHGAASPNGMANVSVVNQEPVAVVQNMTTRGIEYSIMFLSLWISAVSFGGLLHDMIDALMGDTNGKYAHVGGIVAITALLVCLPIFSLLFIRLKSAEFDEPALRRDQSRRKSIQTTLLASFIIGILNVIAIVYIIISGGSDSDSGTDVFALMLHVMVTVAICGGIFAYYWRDIHRVEA
jgi:hypothetical protein